MPVAVNAQAGPSRTQRKAKAPRPSEVDDGGDDDGVDDGVQVEEGWTIETFEDRPVLKNPAVALIRRLMDHTKTLVERENQAIDHIQQTARDTEEAKQDDEAIEELQELLFRCIERRAICNIRISVLQDLEAELRQGHEMTMLHKVFKERSEDRVAKYMAQSQRAKFKDVQEYLDFRQNLWEIHHPHSPRPGLSRWLERGPDDESDDDDIEIGGQTQNYRCCITLRPFEDAVTNEVCGHSYSRKAIDGVLDTSKKNRKEPKCPNPGCNAKVDRRTLNANPILQRKADEHWAREKRRREEEEADDDDHISS